MRRNLRGIQFREFCREIKTYERHQKLIIRKIKLCDRLFIFFFLNNERLELQKIWHINLPTAYVDVFSRL